MKVKVYQIIGMCVESGIKYGLTRAYKHTDEPDREHIEEQIYEAIMNDLHEYLSFEDESSAG